MAAVGVRAGVGHGQSAGLRVPQLEVLLRGAGIALRVI